MFWKKLLQKLREELFILDWRYDGLDWSEGFAAFEKNGQWFHIRSKDGTPAYKERYDLVWSFYKGRARAEKDGQSFHINTNGTPAYEERYDYVGYFGMGSFPELAWVEKDGQGFYIHLDGTRDGTQVRA